VFKGGREGVYRGLTPREYARGMGFPEDYAWPATLGRDVVVRGLGNAVPPPLAREVVSAVLEAA
jgi:site-specific DNA-cytosine methylase